MKCTKKTIKTCIYGAGYANCCCYILAEGHRRPCPPQDCTCYVKTDKVHPKKRGVDIDDEYRFEQEWI